MADSPLADQAGYVDLDQTTLRHVRYPNVFGLGDAGSTPNAKTAAAARKQAPIVAVNLLSALGGGEPVAGYDGYGSCPLTVERGKIVLAEFGYGGKLQPSFPKWMLDGLRPQRRSWLLKAEAAALDLLERDAAGPRVAGGAPRPLRPAAGGLSHDARTFAI